LQKLGVKILLTHNPQTQKGDGLDLEVLKEKASALGVTGRRLRSGLAEYQRHCQGGFTAKQLEELIAAISNTLQELIIQRELLGIPYQNLEWVLRTYKIPDEISAKLGLRDDPDHLFRA
jgi:hypothetical protein